MTTYVLRNGALIEKRLALTRATGRSPHVLSDIAPFMTQEGIAITSRAALRDYERVNGVRQVGTDWTGSERPPFWDRHLAREKARNGDDPRPVRVEEIGGAPGGTPPIVNRQRLSRT